ncbi:adenosylhomocysteinase [Candidatus Micrarchaeota archaeon]|nr:adenosylhomocysteinase [Candidatus Micrarchaeota archaeon]
MEYKVKNIDLAEDGRKKIEWAEMHMPVLMKVRERFSKEKPLNGIRISACLHVTKETAVLVKTLVAGGASVRLAGSNPLSTQDDVAAALAAEGIEVFAWRNQNNEEYYYCLNKCLDLKPNITLDDGADLINTLHTKRTELLEEVMGGQEETTTGVIRLRAMAKDGALRYPVIAVNDTPTKRMFDNFYGTGQSTIDGILRATNVLMAGSNFVVIGYGFCGKGIANRARGMSARVIVVESNPVEALRASMDGFQVMPMKEAYKVGNIFVSATGDKNVMREEHFELMKDGAILANSGHFNVEIAIPDLEKMKKSKKTVRKDVEEYSLKNGKRLFLLAEGRLVNLASAEGHPSEVMDLSFANQSLCSEYLVKNHAELEKRVYDVPKEIDEWIAKLKLDSLGIKTEPLTEDQKKYLASWKEGT